VEYLHSVWQISIIALVVGAMIGAMAYRLLAPSVKKAGKIKTELDSAREKLDSYKDSVNQHFNKTSDLVNDLTQNYVKVYQHLAEGSQTLGDSTNFTNLMEQHQGRVLIAVDDETKDTDKVADELIVDPAVTQAMPVEAIEEPVESFTEVNSGGTDPVSPENDTVKTEVSESSGILGDSVETEEPVLNVDALEEVTEKTVIEERVEADNAVPEGEKKTDVRTTVH
jgi:uncharacterized membrane-anchored protein YhcB (DUF1043 family)